MLFFKRFIGAAASAIEFHFLRFWRGWVATLIFILLFGISWGLLLSAPSDFVPGTVVIIPRGTSVPYIATQLAEAHIIRHPSFLKNLLRFSGFGDRAAAGAYRFSQPVSLFTVAYRLVTAEYGLPPVRVTFIEGMTVRNMAARASGLFPEITSTDFISAGQPYEGYLFPDTYNFPLATNAEEIVAALRANFVVKIKPLESDIAASGHSQTEIITMAALIEREARTVEDKNMISGILWNRITRGMPLQVDAVFGYIFGRDTYSPSFADLSVDSPYNTYKYKGLPPGPIANPGLDSITAAIHPTKTNNLYYLTGRDGLMHYAATYAGHIANRRAYLP